MSKHITAQVSPRLLSTISLFFNATLNTMFSELLQNARRANATRVLVSTHPSELTTSDTALTKIVVQDDGRGIEDLQALLTIGHTEWSAQVQDAETPAGMGFFSLARCPGGVRVSSNGNSVLIDLAVFEGRASAEVVPCDAPQGTCITFHFPVNASQVAGCLNGEARYFPLPVLFNSKPVEQKEFLHDYPVRFAFADYSIGVRELLTAYRETTQVLNFHGHTAGAPSQYLTHVPDVELRVDIANNSCLDLVLPDRSRVVENDKWGALQHACTLAAFKFIRNTKGAEHRLSYHLWKEAASLCIEMPEAAPLLRRVVPSPADSYNTWYEEHEHQDRDGPANPDSLLFGLDDSEERIMFLHDVPGACDMLQPSPAYASYSWYPQRNVEEIFYRVFKGGQCVTVGLGDSAEACGVYETRKKLCLLRDEWQMDSIELVVVVCDARTGARTETAMPVPVMFDPQADDPDAASWLATKELEHLDAWELATQLCTHMFVSREYDSAEESTNNWQAFYDECMSVITERTKGSEAGAREQIIRCLNRVDSLPWLLHSLRADTVTIRSKNSGVLDIAVTFLPPEKVEETADAS